MKLEAFFKPRSIAVIGASRNEEKVGHKIFENLVNSQFQSCLYPINPQTEQLLGFKCYKSVTEVPDNVDLAVIAVPAKIVPMVAEECGVKGVKGIIVISAGFSEIAPTRGKHGYFHWHLEVYPKLTIQAGFENSTGMFINATPSEIATQSLKDSIEEVEKNV